MNSDFPRDHPRYVEWVGPLILLGLIVGTMLLARAATRHIFPHSNCPTFQAESPPLCQSE